MQQETEVRIKIRAVFHHQIEHLVRERLFLCSIVVQPARTAARAPSGPAHGSSPASPTPELPRSPPQAVRPNESALPLPIALGGAKILITSAPSATNLRTSGRISSGVPSGITPREVSIRGPDKGPVAIQSRRSLEISNPGLCTVVKPAMTVGLAFSAAYSIELLRRFILRLSALPVPRSKRVAIWVCLSIQPGMTVRRGEIVGRIRRVNPYDSGALYDQRRVSNEASPAISLPLAARKARDSHGRRSATRFPERLTSKWSESASPVGLRKVPGVLTVKRSVGRRFGGRESRYRLDSAQVLQP